MERRVSRPVVGGPPELPWKVKVVDSQGNPAKVQLVPARVEPAAVTVQVPVEWVNEAVRRMLALENVVRRAVSGMPLELRYPASTAQLAQAVAPRRIQAQGRAASKKRARSLPKAKATTPLAAARRQTRSSQPVAASKKAAKKAMVRAKEWYQIEMRERPSQDESVRKKRLILSEPSEEEEEEERGEKGGRRGGKERLR
ncbi:hypothetical protein RHMOL_Rhmol05G0142500 [Rhododendron molle]|uniref:Uncharacterized protein n=1 Tax=Rhododendron molle TaxID=49168 RepID=A0ACC0NP55_RHOML|nr:hypothetical protein RHMOL_Rhmol05G0142500 [Rhododendron molle]